MGACWDLKVGAVIFFLKYLFFISRFSVSRPDCQLVTAAGELCSLQTKFAHGSESLAV